jgi:1,4-alpha-glucan branching enzyme
MYAYSENFILPLSHDEVVHLKGSLLTKMPGDDWQKRANLRLLHGYQMLNPGKKLMFMGGEFAQGTEWNEAESLPWYLCDYPNHRGIQLLARDLNHLYQRHSALHQADFDASGFAWIDCHDYAQSILSFERKSNSETLICIFNFTPVPRYDYRIGLPQAGEYLEVINSDSEIYGGSNLGNAGLVHADQQAWMHRPASAELTLPPLGFVVLKRFDVEK